MRKFKKTMVLYLSSALILSLAACGDEKSENTTTCTTKYEQTTNEEASEDDVTKKETDDTEETTSEEKNSSEDKTIDTETSLEDVTTKETVTTEKQTTEKQTTEKQTTEKQTTEKQTTEKQTTEKQTTEKQTTEKQTTKVEETTTTASKVEYDEEETMKMIAAMLFDMFHFNRDNITKIIGFEFFDANNDGNDDVYVVLDCKTGKQEYLYVRSSERGLFIMDEYSKEGSESVKCYNDKNGGRCIVAAKYNESKKDYVYRIRRYDVNGNYIDFVKYDTTSEYNEFANEAKLDRVIFEDALYITIDKKYDECSIELIKQWLLDRKSLEKEEETTEKEEVYFDFSGYQQHGRFCEGLAWVCKSDYTGTRYGYINTEGEVVIPFSDLITKCFDCKNGVVVVVYKDDYWHYNVSVVLYDTNGNEIDRINDNAAALPTLKYYNNGNVFIRYAGERYMYINAMGGYIRDAVAGLGEDSGDYSEGLLYSGDCFSTMAAKGCYVMFFDKYGDVALDLSRETGEYYNAVYQATDFKDGKSKIIFKGLDNKRYTVEIDVNGNWLGEPEQVSESYRVRDDE